VVVKFVLLTVGWPAPAVVFSSVMYWKNSIKHKPLCDCPGTSWSMCQSLETKISSVGEFKFWNTDLH
jgi:hypothetical protein